MSPWLPQVPTIGSNDSRVPLLGSQNLPFFALFAFLLLAFFGLFKLIKSRRTTRLPQYDPLPTTAHVRAPLKHRYY